MKNKCLGREWKDYFQDYENRIQLLASEEELSVSQVFVFFFNPLHCQKPSFVQEQRLINQTKQFNVETQEMEQLLASLRQENQE